MRIYVGGPMTGLVNDNYPAFEYACKRLFEAGHLPVSPHLLEANINPVPSAGLSKSDNYKRCIPGDIVALATCESMIVLPGFESSIGTAFELHGAELFELEVFGPAYTSDEFPGGLAEWMDVILDMIDMHLALRVKA